MHRRAALARWCLRVGVSLGIVIYILVDVDTGDLFRALTQVRPTLVAEALLLYLAGQALSAVKWALLGRSVGLQRPVSDYMRFYFIGMFFNLFGPSTIGGDVVRGLYLGGGRRPVLAINSVLFDRASGLALLMAIGAVGLLAFPGYQLPWLLEAGVILGGLALLVSWLTSPSLVRFLPRTNRLRRQVEVDMAPFWRDGRLVLRVSAVAVVFHLSQVVVQWMLARAAGTALPLSYCLIIHPLLSVMMALPVSLGGFGVREGGYLYFLTRIDVDDSIAVTMGLLWWALTVVAGLVGGAMFLVSGAELPKLRVRPAAPAQRATAS